MTKMIIGIHGLANKPEENVLHDYWHRALVEGLNHENYSGDIPFSSVYWAKYLYREPLHEDENFDFDSSFNDEPYVTADEGAIREYKDSWKDDLRAGALGILGETTDMLKTRFGMDALADWVLEKWLKDLAFYYDRERMILNAEGQQEQARTVLQDVLRDEIRKHKGKEIMLIAHSMGTVIAYDVLRDIGRSTAPEDEGLTVSNFVTIGSPLGLPHVKGKIIEEREYDGNNDAARVRTPSIVTGSWVNFADPKDPVAADVLLRNDYRENRHGVRVVDDLVENDYRVPLRPPTKERKRNHHKSYGYLRTPELSRHVRDFLA